jgi:outer membrane lipase/esterase
MRRVSRLRCIVASTTALLVIGAPHAAAAQSFANLTFFGDSFTDTGNGDILANLFGVPDPTPSPPYAPGRASNGPVWAEYFATVLGRPLDAAPSLAGGRNFAVGTARTGATGALGLPIGMLSQGAQYASSGLTTSASGLYVLFGGSLDIFDAALLATQTERDAAVGAAANNVALLASQLYGLGARQFLVPSIANVGLSPRGLASGQTATLTALTAEFNGLLGQRVAGLQGTLAGSTFYGLDLDALFTRVRADAASGGTTYGLTNATVPCFLGPSCATSVFADDLHPTTAAHALIASAAVDAVTGVVPEPATLRVASVERRRTFAPPSHRRSACAA